MNRETKIIKHKAPATRLPRWYTRIENLLSNLAYAAA